MTEQDRIVRSEEEWRALLTPEQYRVLRGHGTEPPFSGALNSEKEPGVYRCAACGAELFRSDAKFDSRSGWPSFFEPALQEAVETTVDRSHGMLRTEVHCRRCGGHLGHVFPDGPDGCDRYCINSVSLTLDPEPGA
jgi:peptide-methionine (R)-S-oxide reductase